MQESKVFFKKAHLIITEKKMRYALITQSPTKVSGLDKLNFEIL